MVANKIPQQFIENDWGFSGETFRATIITTFAIAIKINKKSASLSRLSKSIDKIPWELYSV